MISAEQDLDLMKQVQKLTMKMENGQEVTMYIDNIENISIKERIKKLEETNHYLVNNLDNKESYKAGYEQGRFDEDMDRASICYDVEQENEQLKAELEKKNRVIDKLAQELVENKKWHRGYFLNEKEDMIAHFTKLVEEVTDEK